MSPQAPGVAIIGGGIAGLALAINLHQRGIACRVYEAAASQRELGVGITLLPHAMRELSALGLREKIGASAIENAECAFFNRFGQRIYSEPRGIDAGYPFPECGIHRGRLHMLLYEQALARLGPEALIFGRRLETLTQDEAGVTLHFDAAGTHLQVRASAAIACDGVNSSVRKLFYPEERLCYTGINTWRGVTRRRPILDGRTYIRIGSIRTGKIVIYPIVQYPDTGEQLINWVAELESSDAIPNDWNRTTNATAILSLFRGWNFDWLDVAQLIANAETIFEYPMVDKEPVARWTFGRVTLAGDAAHPMYPRGSNGSAQALIDVRILADALAQHMDPCAAFVSYEVSRRDATAAIVRANRAMPPDLINIKVEELTGDRPFDNLDAFISQDKLRGISENYKRVAGFTVTDVK